jgi:hypothetical protein
MRKAKQLVRPVESWRPEKPAQWLAGRFSFLVKRPFGERVETREALPGIALLVLLAAIRMCWSWAGWGDLSVDAGHETYVPMVLAEGKLLYRDVWYHYGPAAPYLNSYLFRVFGVHLSVLYFAGSFAAVGSAIFLFLSGIEMGYALAGWIAGAVLVLEAFEPGIFGFPLPYSFASVYGCLVACVLLWALLRSLRLLNSGWIFTGAGLAGLGLLLKLEYGIACYSAVGISIVFRALKGKSLRRSLVDGLAILPSVALCIVVIHWMVSIRGIEFITQENIMSWPTSYFMKTYGAVWLAKTGFALNRQAWVEVGKQTIFLAGIFYFVYRIFSNTKQDLREGIIRLSLLVGLIEFYRVFVNPGNPYEILEAAFFPRAMVLYVVIGAVASLWRLLRGGWNQELAGLAMAFGFASVLAWRTLLRTTPDEYSIYYNGPVVLCYLIATNRIVAGVGAKGHSSGRQKAVAFLCLACLFTVAARAALMSVYGPKLVALQTERGALRVPEAVARNYEAGVAFLKQKYSEGETVLIVPEDTTMYFLSGTHAPTRVYIFTPGVVSPGRMTKEIVQEIDEKRIRYLLWSNRTFAEYGVPFFGQDFNKELASALKERYEEVGPLVPSAGADGGLAFTFWRRRQEGTVR